MVPVAVSLPRMKKSGADPMSENLAIGPSHHYFWTEDFLRSECQDAGLHSFWNVSKSEIFEF